MWTCVQAVSYVARDIVSVETSRSGDGLETY